MKQIVSANVETGEKWILLENFENTVDIRGMLRHHITIDQDFHHGYRLWIVTAPNENFPSPELKKCSKLTSGQALSIREAIYEAFTKDQGGIKEAKCWSGERQLIGGAERHMSRLLYCLAFFHASLNEVFSVKKTIQKIADIIRISFTYPCFFYIAAMSLWSHWGLEHFSHL